MPKRRRITGSKLLGEELRRRRGRRSLEEIARLSRTTPHADRVEPIAYSTLSMLERGVTMPSAQSLLTLSVIYHVPVQQFMDLIGLERYHARKPLGSRDAVQLERDIVADLRSGLYGDAYARSLACLDLVRERARFQDRRTTLDQRSGVRLLAGLALWKLGWLSQASSVFREVVDDLDAKEELRGWAYQNLVEVERACGRLASARAYARDGLEVACHIGGPRLQGTFHATLANLERDMAERAETPERRRELIARALEHHAQAQRLARETGDQYLLANDLLNEGVTRLLQGELELARRRLQEGRHMAAERGHARLHAFSLLEEGKLLIAEQRHAQARELLWQAEKEASTIEANDLLFQCSYHLLTVAEALGDDTSETYRRCLSLEGLQEARFRELEEFENRQEAREAMS